MDEQELATADDVMNCYRAILDREPETQQVIDDLLRSRPTRWELVRNISHSEELSNKIISENSVIRLRLLEKSSLAGSFYDNHKKKYVFHHFSYLIDLLTSDALSTLLNNDQIIYKNVVDGKNYNIKLSLFSWHFIEGESSLYFDIDNTPIYTISFTIVPGDSVGLEDHRAILVSRMQGEPGRQKEIGEATKAFQQIHPQALLFAALQGLALAIGVRRIAGVCATNHVWYVEGEREHAARLVAAYDRFFESIQAVRSDNGFYIAESSPSEKPMSLVKPGHRLRTKLKRRIKAELTHNAQVFMQARLEKRDDDVIVPFAQEGVHFQW